MPRKPTGNPTGRPKGSGRLGLGTQDAHTRLTLRIPNALYARLEAFAAGRHFRRGSVQLSACVRDAVAHYLTCPTKKQTSNIPVEPAEPQVYDTWQTESTPSPRRDPEDLDEMHLDPVAMPQKSAPPVRDFNPHKYMLGSSCKAGHLSHGEAGNLRVLVGGACLACAVVKKMKAKAKRPAPVTKEV